jgi:DNA-binding NtrC family response regulator
MADRIVLVDDEPEVLDIQEEALRELGATIRKFKDPSEAWLYLQREPASLVVTDWNMPGMTGMELLFKTRGLNRPPYVIVLTAFGTVERAVEAINAGAFNFLEKPFEINAYVQAVKDALDRYHCIETTLLRKNRPSTRLIEPACRSAAMQRTYETACAAAQTESSVLLLGESGTGKEVLADYIHRHGPRAGGPIVKVNCGALPEHLMESELFGHEKGAFTGADRRTIGRFEQASGGTLFLDEIGDLLPNLQVKLLRALQDRVIERVGSASPISVDFRLICATHQDLQAAVAAARFREDLYYRIHVVPIRVPTLRERLDDIEPLALEFFRALRVGLKKAPQNISGDALAALKSYAWPGNVRQLRNAVEYALVLAKGDTIRVEDLPEEVRTSSPRAALPPVQQQLSTPSALTQDAATPDPLHDLKTSVGQAEADLIRAALARNHWQMSKTAKDLKISRSTLYARMKDHGIERPG